MITYIIFIFGKNSTMIIAINAESRNEAEEMFAKEYGNREHEITNVIDDSIKGIVSIGTFFE